jgi:hypothetical protein
VGKRALKYWLISQDNYNTDPLTTGFPALTGSSLARSGSNTNAHAMSWYVPRIPWLRTCGWERSAGVEALPGCDDDLHRPTLSSLLTPLVRTASAAKTSVCDGYWLGAAIEIRRLRANNTTASKQTWIMGCIHRRKRCGGVGYGQSADPFCCACESLCWFLMEVWLFLFF